MPFAPCGVRWSSDAPTVLALRTMPRISETLVSRDASESLRHPDHAHDDGEDRHAGHDHAHGGVPASDTELTFALARQRADHRRAALPVGLSKNPVRYGPKAADAKGSPGSVRRDRRGAEGVHGMEDVEGED